eukprot:c17960_g1_i1.p1 GENE.c17960_g1_i1~~c17960_g1_i1.p1  ORF type:complete len:278 (-),score=52.70 c17960_g1_i1:46-843(-)
MVQISVEGRLLIPLTIFAAIINFRYGTVPINECIAFFLALYDPLHNLVASIDYSSADALAQCTPGTECSLFPNSTYSLHPAWGVSFYDRFVGGTDNHRFTLYVHVWCQTLALIFCLFQFYAPLRRTYPHIHRWMGRSTLILMCFGVGSSVLLSAEHDNISSYGGIWSHIGFHWMGAWCFFPALVGFISILRGRIESHKKWMTRFYGSMLGSYFIFRFTEFILGPILIWYKTVSILFCMWVSAPAGFFLAELWMRRGEKKNTSIFL